MAESALRVAFVFPELLGTYGDRGNAAVLVARLGWRDIACELVPVPFGQPVPSSCDIYVLGGGEDAPQSLAIEALQDGRPLEVAVEAGAAVLAVCAGLQLLGTRFLGGDGVDHDGLGMLDLTTGRHEVRAIGEIVVEPAPELDLPLLTGYENHGGATALGPGCVPLGRVLAGVGNDGVAEGARAGRIIGTYLHGPVLARNPALADLVLGWATDSVLAPLEDQEVDELRRQRLAAALPDGRHRR